MNHGFTVFSLVCSLRNAPITQDSLETSERQHLTVVSPYFTIRRLRSRRAHIILFASLSFITFFFSSCNTFYWRIGSGMCLEFWTFRQADEGDGSWDETQQLVE